MATEATENTEKESNILTTNRHELTLRNINVPAEYDQQQHNIQ